MWLWFCETCGYDFVRHVWFFETCGYDLLRVESMIFWDRHQKLYSSQLTKIAWHPSIRCTNDTCVVFSRYHGWTKKCTYPKNNKILKLKGKLI